MILRGEGVRDQSSRTVVNQLVWTLPEADKDGAEDFVSINIAGEFTSRKSSKRKTATGSTSRSAVSRERLRSSVTRH